LSFVIDRDIAPGASELPPLEEGGAPRPLAALADPYGNRADFVANELIVVTDDEEALAELVQRWRGTVLTTIEPAQEGFDGLRARHVVRIHPRQADAAELARELSELNPKAYGEHRLSSPEGLDLLGAATLETRLGLEIGLNWVHHKATFPNRSAIEQSGLGNAYGWTEFCHSRPVPLTGCGLDIGVGEAWTVLQQRGILSPAGVIPAGRQIPIAILDSGFTAFDADSPVGSRELAPLGPDFTNCSNLCPFHGALVTSAAVAVPDNNFGTAGTGGPVGTFVQIADGGTMGSVQDAITTAGKSARIINMSFGGEIPALAAIFTGGFDSLVQSVRDSGVLIFAAAGNSGKDVDGITCIITGCWEHTYHWPCETAGVICVGGLGFNSLGRDPSSNFGTVGTSAEKSGLSPEKSVDIFAPFDVTTGPDPSILGPSVRLRQGTSFSSPFAAGVAALVWAAGGGVQSTSNPGGLTANQVESTLLGRSHSGFGLRYVWAWSAVKAALGDVPPVANAGPGQTVDELSHVIVDGSASSDPDGGQLAFSWVQVSGPGVAISNRATATPSFTAPGVTGPATLVFAVTVSNGLSSDTDTVTIAVRDVSALRTSPVLTVPPDIEVTTSSLSGMAVTYAVSATDKEDPNPVVSCTPPSGSKFPVGTKTVTCTATDFHGDQAVATFTVHVEFVAEPSCPGKPWQCDPEPPK